MRIAVSGASGFVGRHVISALRRRGIEIVALTRQSDLRLEELGIEQLHFDLADTNAIDFVSIGKPDVLVHFAWEGLPNYCSLHHISVEAPRQFSLLSRLVREGLTCLVGVGTCMEYGLVNGPLSEELCTTPIVPYALAKDILRRQLECLKIENDFKLCWARLFYMYGEGQSSNSLYSQLMAAASAGEKSFKMSAGEQLRDYLPVEDVANIVADLALARRDLGVINVCSGRPISVRRFVEDRIKQKGLQIIPNLGIYPYPDWEPIAFWGSRTKLDKFYDQFKRE